MANKNNIMPKIIVVEKMVFQTRMKNTNNITTQTEVQGKSNTENKETQHQNNQNLISVDHFDLTEEEKDFLYTIAKNKADLNKAMKNYKDPSQKMERSHKSREFLDK